MSKLLGPAAVAAAALAAGTALYRSLLTGRVTLDLGVGRRTRALGPLSVDIAAPPETVFAAAAAPYAERRPRALMEKVHILERTDQMVLAAHNTPVGKHLTAVTVETVILDVLALAGLHALRVMAGSAAVGIPPSAWLIAFCGFLFFSLAMIKRYAELVLMRTIDGARAHARAYELEDSELLAALGGASGYLAVLVLAL